MSSVQDAAQAVQSVGRVATEVQFAITSALQSGRLTSSTTLASRAVGLAADTEFFGKNKGAPIYYNRLPGETVEAAAALMRAWYQLGADFAREAGVANPAEHQMALARPWMPTSWTTVLVVVGIVAVGAYLVYRYAWRG